MSNMLFTSDWHVGHRNCLVFDERPFTGLDHMHAVLIANYNSVVSYEDVCYFLGDFAMGSAKLASSVLAQLNGTKVCLLGNHDRGTQAMLNMGFDAVMCSASLVLGNELVSLAHCPKMGVWREDTSGMPGQTGKENWHGEAKNRRFSVEDFGQFHLHGHIHSRLGVEKSQRELGRQYDVGCVANGYRPVSADQIVKWMTKVKQQEKLNATSV